MPAPISACLIVRDEPFLEKALQSVRDHVDEIVVVDTGSTDTTTLEVARKYADRVELFTGCNDPETGLIEDFSVARQHAFSFAKNEWIMWLDADDEVFGAENLPRLLQHGQQLKRTSQREIALLYPYEYTYNERGECVCLHYRERLISNKDAFRWVNPVHEVLVPIALAQLHTGDDLVFKHRRQYSQKKTELGRNLRILRKYIAKVGESDARQLYYLGLECANNGLWEEGIQHLWRYIDISGWDDERCMAALKLIEIYTTQAAVDGTTKETQLKLLNEGVRAGFKAIECRDEWSEGYIALSKLFYRLAMLGAGGSHEQRNWERCASFAKRGLALPPTKTLLFVNPIEREYDIHRYYNTALARIGDAAGALESCNTGLRRRPDDGNLQLNKKVYETHLAVVKAQEALAVLTSNGTLEPQMMGVIQSILSKQPHPLTSGPANSWSEYRKPEGYPRGVTVGDFPVARTTPHAQAWGIPEAWEHDDLPVRMTEAQLQSVVMLLWKEYLLHDEVTSAESFLRMAPYRVRHSTATERALWMTQKTTAWMDDVDGAAQRVNQHADATKESGVPLPGALSGQLAARWMLVTGPLRNGERLLDLGCSDGSMSNRLGMCGYDVTGVDLCRVSLGVATMKAKEFQTGATFVDSLFEKMADRLEGTFDTAICSDTYEHVKEPVSQLIAPTRRVLKPSGRMILCTPHGAWMRGQFVSWAHPWRNADDKGRSWLSLEEPRGHMVAPTPWSVAADFRADGWWVKDSHVVIYDGPFPDVDGQGHVYAEAYISPPSTSCGQTLDIVMACGDTLEEWTPASARRHGIGGSETAVIELTERLVRQGHRVRVYNKCGPNGEGIYSGVEYHKADKLDLVSSCDVLVAWRFAPLLDHVQARLKLLWVHDVTAVAANHGTLLQADRILALTDWHRDHLIAEHNVPAEQVIRTRNGIDLSRFSDKIVRNPHKVVYSSSPDRALPSLLQMWPQIRERVSDAELHVFYGFGNWEARAQDDKTKQLITVVKDQLNSLRDMGVVFRGRVPQQELAREFLSAGAWLYPTWWHETSCITAMEAQAAGLRIVTSSLAALDETVADRGVRIQGDWMSTDYQKAFIEAAVNALRKEGDEDRQQLQRYAESAFSWDGVAAAWNDLLLRSLHELADQPLVPYRAVRGFQR